jgi:hypothetical protein
MSAVLRFRIVALVYVALLLSGPVIGDDKPPSVTWGELSR